MITDEVNRIGNQTFDTYAPILYVSCLGDFRISFDGQEWHKLRPKVGELFGLLLLNGDNVVGRTEAASQIWGYLGDKQGELASLRAHVMRLSRALGSQSWRLRSTKTTLSIDSTNMHVDLFDFKRDLASAVGQGDPDRIESVLATYGGEFQRDSKAQSIESEKLALRELFINESDALAGRLARDNRRTKGLQVLWRALRLYPEIEELAALVLRYCEDEPREARKVYRWHLKAIASSAASQRVEHQYNQIVRFKISPERGSRRSVLNIAERFEKVPVPQHPLIGRAEELERIINRLAQSSLVALAGPAGVGKTRIALEIGVRRATAYRNGAVFVDLSQLARDESVESIAETIRVSLEIEAAPDSAVKVLAAFLARRHMLLILDNVEHIISSTTSLASSLLSNCKGLTILLTSQIELDAGYAARVRIDPLPIPHEGTSTVADLRDYGGAQLFEYIARNSIDDYVLTDSDASTVANILRRTEGIPAVIQLVASARSISLREMLDQVEYGLASIESLFVARRGASRRSPMEAIGWSYRLLSTKEQQLLNGLAVFPGEWFRGAVDGMFGNSDFGDVKPTALLDRLQARSLIERQEVGGRSRYRLLGMVREFALERLRKARAHEDAQQRHLDYYLDRVEAVAQVKNGPDLNEALAQLTVDMGNLRTALNFSLDSNQSEKSLRLATGLVRLFLNKGMVIEADNWMRRVAELGASVDPPLRRKAFHSIATIAFIRNDFVCAKKFWERCHKLSKESLEESWLLQDEGNLGNVALAMQDYDHAHDLFHECFQEYTRRDNRRGVARSLGNLALVSRGRKDFKTAVELYSQSIAIFRELSDNYSIALGLNNLATILIASREYVTAHSVLTEAIDLSKEQENFVNLVHSLSNYFDLAVAQRDPERAAVICGALELIRRKHELPLPIEAQFEYQEARLRLEEQLGEFKFKQYRRIGEHTSLPELCRYAKSQVQLVTDAEMDLDHTV